MASANNGVDNGVNNGVDKGDCKQFYYKITREDNSEDIFTLLDVTIYPPESNSSSDFAGFLHSIRHIYLVKYYHEYEWVDAKDYQKQAVLDLHEKYIYCTYKPETPLKTEENYNSSYEFIPNGIKFKLTKI